MKKIVAFILTLSYCFIAESTYCQSPFAIPYQAVARNVTGNLITNQTISLRFSIHHLTTGGTVVYKETQNATTNSLGLFNVTIGEGTPVTGTITSVDWSSGAKFIQVEIDPTGGTTYVNMGTTQLMSVPYSLFANRVKDLPTNASNGCTMHWNGTTWVADNTIYNNGTNIGIGTTSPTEKLHTTGGVRHENLSGTGLKTIYADINGKLTTLPRFDSILTVNSLPALPIPENSCPGLSDYVNVSGLPTQVNPASISIKLNITHQYLGDLRVYLVTPSNQILNLIYNNGGANQNFTNTVFSDLSSVQLSAGNAPFTNRYHPVGNLLPNCSFTPTYNTFSSLGGGVINPNGIWTLVVIDNGVTNTGTLDSWSITIGNSVGNLLPNVWDDGINIGIGQPNPTKLLDVNGDALINGITVGTGPSIFSPNNNTVFGHNALNNNYDGVSNTAIGEQVLLANTSGHFNTAIGRNALKSNTIGNGNIATGYESLFQNTLGTWNVGIGYSSLYYNTTGSNNVALGNGTGGFNTTGSDNTFLGARAGSNTSYPNLNNTTVIGANATVTASNSIVLGSIAGLNNATNSVNVGIGTTAPIERLDVVGTIKASAYRCRQGNGGTLGGNVFNYFWSGSNLQAWVDNTFVGNVSLTSDRRLKDQINPMRNDALDKIMKLKPVSFHYKNVEGTIFKENPLMQEGFIADELQEVIPSAVIGEKDALTSDGKIQPQTLNMGPVVSVLTKAVQEQNLKFENLNSKYEEVIKQNYLLLKQIDELKTLLKK